MPNYEMINGKRSTHFYTIVRASLRRGSVNKRGGQESQALRRSRGGFSTKIHACVDALGYPPSFLKI
jgi:hypothetical protein